MERNIAHEDAEALYLGNLNTVSFDLSLPQRGKQGSEIAWKSDNLLFLRPDGHVVRPAYGRGSRDVTLQARLQYGEQTAERSFTVHILEEKIPVRLGSVRPVTVSAAPGETFFLPAAAVAQAENGELIAVPVSWDDGAEQMYAECGQKRASGVLKDIMTPVTAEITVQRTMPAAPRKIWAEPFLSPMAVLDKGGPFWDAQCRGLRHLLTLDVDRLLWNFRVTAGLDTRGAQPMEGWDAPDSKLRGHTTGHCLSALALAWEATGEAKIREKAETLLDGLRECQAPSGYLGGFPEKPFDELENLTPYPAIWAPYYTLHKLLAGLLDCSRAFQSETALQTAVSLGGWVCRRLEGLTHEQLSAMWSTYIAGEFGGLGESMVRLCELTGDRRYLSAARRLDNDKLFYPMSLGLDALTGLHANQHIPQAIGALRMYAVCGEERYYQIASHFWDIVTNSHVYAVGGTGEGEMFHQPGLIGHLLSDQTAESCASYNMLKLTGELYRYEPKSVLMEYFERTLHNHILAAAEPNDHGGTTYFLPLAPGFRKLYSGDDENTCCHGTGLESAFKYADCAYARFGDALAVNLFINSHIRWKEKNIVLYQTVREERDGIVTSLRLSGAGTVRLHVRRPAWLSGEAVFSLNGKPVVLQEADSYFAAGLLSDGDILVCRFPCKIYLESPQDAPELATVCWGPWVLAAVSPEKKPLSLVSSLEQTGDGPYFRLGAAGAQLMPLYMIKDEPYQVYLARP